MARPNITMKVRNTFDILHRFKPKITVDAICQQQASWVWFPIINMMNEQNLTIGQVLELIWIKAADMDTGDMLKVVQFAANLTQKDEKMLDTTSTEWFHFLGVMESLNLYFQTAIEKYNNEELANDKVRFDNLITEYQKKEATSSFIPLYQLIIEHWDYLKNYVKTYNLLQSMAELQTGWLNLAEDRIELLRILYSIQTKEGGDSK